VVDAHPAPRAVRTAGDFLPVDVRSGRSRYPRPFPRRHAMEEGVGEAMAKAAGAADTAGNRPSPHRKMSFGGLAGTAAISQSGRFSPI